MKDKKYEMFVFLSFCLFVGGAFYIQIMFYDMTHRYAFYAVSSYLIMILFVMVIIEIGYSRIKSLIDYYKEKTS